MINWFKGFLSSGDGDASSKRLLMVLSYIVALGIAIASLFTGLVLTTNTLILLCALCGVSTGNYTLTNKNEVKKDSE